jgi:hypothetical protein
MICFWAKFSRNATKIEEQRPQRGEKNLRENSSN